MKKVALHNLGCKVNAYETEVMQQKFENAGYEIVPFDEVADIYVINTCTVTNIADRKSRQMLHRAKKQNKDAVVVAVGCYVQVAEEKLKDDDAVDIIVGNNKKNEIVEIINKYNADKTENKAVFDIGIQSEFEDMMLETVKEHTRAYIKIQDGCNQFCSYCIIPYARGRIRSRKIKSILDEVKQLVSQGYKEVVLTGIHVSSYGRDFENENAGLADVIENLDAVDGLERIRLSSLEPGIITEKFAETLSKSKKICPHFHLSLQSGCDATLKRMNRHYTSDEYYEKCCILRKYFDNPAITTDVKVGFPGETEEEFIKTEQFVRRVEFADMHIFKYSKRQGTKAATMENQVDDNLKNERSRKLIELAAENAEKYRSSHIGQNVSVLFEEETEINGVKYWTGYTKEYIKTAVRLEENLENKILNVRIFDKLNEEIMLAQL